tara:strand:+ start:440 stop:613 length:174 start_codon:yes stop_codon:yes gene_type:complete
MKKVNTIIWFIWFLLVVIWNYGCPNASPFLDILIVVILSIINIIVIKVLIKKLKIKR